MEEAEEVREGGDDEWSQRQKHLEDNEVIYASTSLNAVLPGTGGRRGQQVEADQELDAEQYELMLTIEDNLIYKNLPHTLSQVMPDIYENCPHIPHTS